jgi:sugar-specific transcriptional regulator TrmB
MNALPQKIVTLFQQFGVSSQEAKAYLSLLEKDNVTGYGLGKNAGIHSSKIYNVIGKLLDRDFIIATDTRPVRYFPRKPSEVVGIIKKAFEDSVKTLNSDINRMVNHSKSIELITWNITNRADVFRKVREMIQGTEKNIFLASWSKELRPIRTVLTRAIRSGVQSNTVIYGFSNFDAGTIFQHQPSDFPSRERGQRRFIFTSDNNKAVIANFAADGSGSGLWTENNGLVMLFRDFIIHEIYIIRIQQALPGEVRHLFGERWEKIRPSNERNIHEARP